MSSFGRFTQALGGVVETLSYASPILTLTQSVGTTPLTATIPSGGISGSGTTNNLPKFTASTIVGNSKFFDDGTNQGTETTTAVNRFIMSANASIAKIFSFRSGNLPRWAFRVDGTESGANAGADLAIRRYNDAGTYVDSPLFIKRSTGCVGINTITPLMKLDIVGTSGLPATSGTTPVGSLRLHASNNAILDFGVDNGTANGWIQSTDVGELSLYYGLMLNPRGGNVLIGTTTDGGFKLDVNGTARVQGQLTNTQTSATQIQSQIGNSNTQGTAQLQKIVRQYSVVSLGTKLIIPFVFQTNLNSTTFVRIIGHSARFNSTSPLAFSAEFALGNFNALSNLLVLQSSGNILTILINGMNIEITFVSGYTAGTADGIYTTIEYMTNNLSYSIDVPNITMN
jgi:hypothetical protein